MSTGRGKVSTKAEPSPLALLARSDPPISSARRRLITSPMPVPCCDMRSRPSRLNGWNNSPICCAVMPSPLSVTTISTVSLARARLATWMRPASLLYLTAFDSRLVRICLTRVASPSTDAAPSPSSVLIVMRRRIASDCTIGSVAASNSCRLSRSSFSFRLPDSMRERSSTSLIISSRCQPACWICATQGFCASASGWRGSSSSSCAKPSIAFSGVRNSWLMRDRNSLLARFERSATSRACSASLSSRCSVMSSTTPTMRRGCPCASRSSDTVTCTHSTRRSLVR